MTRLATRTAFSLMELTVVLAIMGVVASVATSMLGSSRVVDSLHARVEAQQLACQLRLARTTAISCGRPVRFEAVIAQNRVVGYRILDPLQQIVASEHYFSQQIASNWSARAVELQPTGMSDQSLKVVFEGDAALWTLELHSGSGQVVSRQQPR